MGLIVLPPESEDDHLPVEIQDAEDDSDASMGEDEDGPPSKRRRLSSSFRQISLPGETITDDTQWMR